MNIDNNKILDDKQVFDVVVDGIQKKAKVLNILKIDDKKYVIYSIDNGNDTSDIFSSEVVKDEDGYDKLVDILDPNIRKKILVLINAML